MAKRQQMKVGKLTAQEDLARRNRRRPVKRVKDLVYQFDANTLRLRQQRNLSHPLFALLAATHD